MSCSKKKFQNKEFFFNFPLEQPALHKFGVIHLQGSKCGSKTLSLLEFTVAKLFHANSENVKRSLLFERTNRPGLIFEGLECPLVNQLLDNACGHILNSKQLFQPDGVFRTKRKSVLSNLFKSKQLKPNTARLQQTKPYVYPQSLVKKCTSRNNLRENFRIKYKHFMLITKGVGKRHHFSC